jgi:hypothetical protein
MEMMTADALSPAFQVRIEKAMSGGRQPGHYRVGGAPVGLWNGVDSDGSVA